MRKPPPPEPLKALGERVRARRHELGLSQEGLGDVSGLHWTFVGQVERGQRNISFVNLLRVAQALQVDPAVLVTGLVPPAE